MATQKVDDAQIIEGWKHTPSTTALARKLGISQRVMASRLGKLRAKGVVLPCPDTRSPHYGEVYRQKEEYPPRLAVKVDTGYVLVGSDAHYGPETSTAHKAFVKLCRELKPIGVVMNGDVFDGASVSRWPRMGWEQRLTVKQELEAVDKHMSQIEDVVKGGFKVWTLGNHCARYELRLAQSAPEYEGVPGFTLKEHFPLWRPCWSIWINDDVVVKHRFKGGIHATHNNTLWAGKTMVTGHLHSLKVTPLSDYNGTRWGVDTGTLAEPYGGVFEGYMEDSPRNWRSGFIVLSFHKGRLLWPEVVDVLEEGKVSFRGKVIEV